MKKLTLILILIGFNYTTSIAQSFSHTFKEKNGLALTTSGIVLTVGGITTIPDQYYKNGVWLDKPFHKQGARSSIIVCGISLTITGLITSIIK